jgi:hypothetical protein
VSEPSATLASSREVKFLGNPIEELLRRLREHVRHDENEGVVGSGFDRCEDERNVRRLSQSSPVDARYAATRTRAVGPSDRCVRRPE